MNARIKATGFLGAIYVLMSCIFYEIVIQAVSNKTPVLKEMDEIETILISSGNLTQINFLLDQTNDLYDSIK